jgi:hypothetical protein
MFRDVVPAMPQMKYKLQEFAMGFWRVAKTS